jgi:hypothetical protein
MLLSIPFVLFNDSDDYLISFNNNIIRLFTIKYKPFLSKKVETENIFIFFLVYNFYNKINYL